MSLATIQAAFTTAMDTVFDYFHDANTVTFYKDASEEVVISDSSWNSDFGNPIATNIAKTAQSKEIVCRLWYMDKGPVILGPDSADNIALKFGYPIGTVRLQIKAADFDWLKLAKAFYIQGIRYRKDTDWSAKGAFQIINRYEVFLVKDQ